MHSQGKQECMQTCLEGFHLFDSALLMRACEARHMLTCVPRCSNLHMHMHDVHNCMFSVMIFGMLRVLGFSYLCSASILEFAADVSQMGVVCIVDRLSLAAVEFLCFFVLFQTCSRFTPDISTVPHAEVNNISVDYTLMYNII